MRPTKREGLSSRTGSMRALGMRENPGSNPGGRERKGRGDFDVGREREREKRGMR